MWYGAFDVPHTYNSSIFRSAIGNGFCFHTVCSSWDEARYIDSHLSLRWVRLNRWHFWLRSRCHIHLNTSQQKKIEKKLLWKVFQDLSIQISYLWPSSNNPSEWVDARSLAFANLSWFFIFRNRQMRTIFRIHSSAIFDWMRILWRLWIKTHANRLLNSDASSTCRRALWEAWTIN